MKEKQTKASKSSNYTLRALKLNSAVIHPRYQFLSKWITPLSKLDQALSRDLKITKT
jgi:hypothetical protein